MSKIENLTYEKHIEVSDTGMVEAKVYSSDGRRIALNFFSAFFNSPKSIKKQADKAHEWADGIIKLAEQNEVISTHSKGN